MLSQSEETKEQHQVLFLRGQETQERLRKIPGFSFFGQRRPKNKKQFFVCFFSFWFYFQTFFLFFSYIFVYCVFLWLQCFFSIFGNFFFLYRIWYWAWNGNRGEKHFPLYVTGWKIAILFYKGVVVIVVIVEEFVYIFFYVASKWGVCVSKEQDCWGIQYPFL